MCMNSKSLKKKKKKEYSVQCRLQWNTDVTYDPLVYTPFILESIGLRAEPECKHMRTLDELMVTMVTARVFSHPFWMFLDNHLCYWDQRYGLVGPLSTC